MNIAVDIGNTRVKCGLFLPDRECEVGCLPLPPRGGKFADYFLHRMLQWDFLSDEVGACGGRLTADDYPAPITWWIAQTGSFPWQTLKAEILKIRTRDQFKIITRQHIPLEVDVDAPEKVGIDRLLAAFAATTEYGDVPMLIVDAGSAITVDVVQNQTFRGGAILPGLAALSATYPKISENLPVVPVPNSPSATRPVYPGKNTQSAIQSGLYWGIIGAIRQFYGALRESRALLILTGGDAEYFLPGLASEIATLQPKHRPHLVLEGIRWCGFR